MSFGSVVCDVVVSIVVVGKVVSRKSEGLLEECGYQVDVRYVPWYLRTKNVSWNFFLDRIIYTVPNKTRINTNPSCHPYKTSIMSKPTCSKDPWVYRGKNLKHLDFPLGGIGTGNILLQGDGGLRGWDILNQFHSPRHRPLHNLPPLHKSSSTSDNINCWAISAAYDDDTEPILNDQNAKEQTPRQAFLLRSANHHGIRDNNDEQDLESTGEASQTIPQENLHAVLPPEVPEVSVRARYPIAEISYQTPPSFPLADVTIEAMTPLVPNDIKASGSPMAIFVVSFTNPHPTKTVSVDVMQSTLNFIGWDGRSREFETEDTSDSTEKATVTDELPSCIWGGNLNEPFVHCTNPPDPPPPKYAQASNDTNYWCKGLFLHTQNELKEDLTRKGSIALSAIYRSSSSIHQHPKTSTIPSLADNHITPSVTVINGVTSEKDLFRRFRKRDFEDVDPDKPNPPSPKGSTYAGAVVQSLSKIPPGATARVTFCLSWHFPYRPCTAPRTNLPPDFYGNLYASWYAHAKDVATQFCDSFSGKSNHSMSDTTVCKTQKSKNLIEITRLFVESLYGSTIPWEILESAAGRLAIPRSPTMFRTEAGIVLGNSGNDEGPINATHVYGYTTLLERIFPGLSRDMLISTFVRNFDLGSGGCLVSFGEGGFAIDGALACVIKVYLVVRQSDPGLEFLGQVWPNVKRQMEAILEKKQYLDARDGVITGPQQTTYGGPMNGANTMVGSYLVTALKATEAMANLMGDVNFAKKCSKQAPVTSSGYESRCWNEEFGYYTAEVDQSNCQNSYGTGCFLDQLVGTSLSRACGFGSIFDPSHEARARVTILRNNVVTNPPFRDENAILCAGDSGLRICTYPHGKVGDGMPSSDMVASGMVYPLVAGLISDGNWDDAIKVCSFVRSRQSGIHKSPWNEPESGLYSARSMSGWNVFDEACGFTYDSTRAAVGFFPKINSESFSCFCSFCNGFGEFKQEHGACDDDGKFSSGKASFKALYGSIDIKSIQLATCVHVVEASLGGETLKASVDATGLVTFDTKITIGEDSTLTLTLSSPCGAQEKPSCLIDVKKVAIDPTQSSFDSKQCARQDDRRKRIRFLAAICIGISMLYWWILRMLSFPSAPYLRVARNA